MGRSAGDATVPCQHAKVTVVYTDGACSGNPGPGGWAWAVPDGAFASGYEGHSTNQRMEIMAAWDAARSISGPLEVVSDSTYVVKCFTDKWYEGWHKRGWTNSAKKPVANRDLWEPFIELYLDRLGTPDVVSFRWVKGHSGDKMNDLVDRLAVEAATRQEARSGDHPPDTLGPADSNGSGSEGDDVGPPVVVPALPGHAIAVFGHRPPELGGYDENMTTATLRRQLAEIFTAKAEMHPNLTIASGLRLGAETIAAEVALETDVPFVAVLPFPNPDKLWPSASRQRFRSLTDRAFDVYTIQRKEPDSKPKAGAALARLDAWLLANATEAVVVWDGRDKALGALHKKAETALGDDVWVLEPHVY